MKKFVALAIGISTLLPSIANAYPLLCTTKSMRFLVNDAPKPSNGNPDGWQPIIGSGTTYLINESGSNLSVIKMQNGQATNDREIYTDKKQIAQTYAYKLEKNINGRSSMTVIQITNDQKNSLTTIMTRDSKDSMQYMSNCVNAR